MPNLSNSKGVIVPIIEANNTTPNKAIETTNLTEKDIPMLRDMIHDIIQKELLSRNKKYIS